MLLYRLKYRIVAAGGHRVFLRKAILQKTIVETRVVLAVQNANRTAVVIVLVLCGIQVRLLFKLDEQLLRVVRALQLTQCLLHVVLAQVRLAERKQTQVPFDEMQCKLQILLLHRQSASWLHSNPPRRGLRQAEYVLDVLLDVA